MEQEVLRKVQPILLEMLKEIRRVCDENGIRYFLYRGTFLGAVRHKGFIPWDDDMDVAMLRSDYEKFCEIAPQKLSDEYCFQNWHTDRDYAHPFGKVRKRGTVYVEAKCRRLPENGFYIDAVWGRAYIPWTYDTNIPHESFSVWDDEDSSLYCQAIVFDIADVKGGAE